MLVTSRTPSPVSTPSGPLHAHAKSAAPTHMKVRSNGCFMVRGGQCMSRSEGVSPRISGASVRQTPRMPTIVCNFRVPLAPSLGRDKMDTASMSTPDAGERRLLLRIALLSILILFLEMLLVRWIGTEVRIFAYLPNGVLVAAFLGLGL